MIGNLSHISDAIHPVIEKSNCLNRFNQIAVLTALLCVLAGVGLARKKPLAFIEIPKGRNILVDGKLSPGEWNDALPIVVSDSAIIYLKRDNRYIYVAIKPAVVATLSVDLYLDSGREKRVLDLHASAKLGEREGQFGQWPEWKWWNNRGWVANVTRVTDFDALRFLADETKEYQIELRRFRARHVWLSADVQVGNELQSIPRKGRQRSGRRWLGLKLKSL